MPTGPRRRSFCGAREPGCRTGRLSRGRRRSRAGRPASVARGRTRRRAAVRKTPRRRCSKRSERLRPRRAGEASRRRLASGKARDIFGGEPAAQGKLSTGTKPPYIPRPSAAPTSRLPQNRFPAASPGPTPGSAPETGESRPATIAMLPCESETSAFGPSPSRLSRPRGLVSAHVFFGRALAFAREAVHVARRLTGFGCLPAGFEQLVPSQADQDRVEGAGLKAGVTADVVAIAPAGWRSKEGVKHLDGLRRQSQRRSHGIKSTYIELVCQV